MCHVSYGSTGQWTSELMWLSGETHHCPRSSVSLFECLDIGPSRRQTSALLWTSDHCRPSAQPPSPSPACHHGSYCCTVNRLRWLVSTLRAMEIVQLLKCIMCIAWTFSTSPQKPLTIYTRKRLIREYIRYMLKMSIGWNACWVVALNMA